MGDGVVEALLRHSPAAGALGLDSDRRRAGLYHACVGAGRTGTRKVVCGVLLGPRRLLVLMGNPISGLALGLLTACENK
jgi:hypothetical protein